MRQLKFLKKVLFLLPLVALASDPSSAASVRRSADHGFAGYSVPLYRGKIHLPYFSGSQRDYSEFRSRLLDSARSGVAVGGKYAMAEWGCGTGCVMFHLIDLTKGTIIELIGGEDYPYLRASYRPDSRLMKFQYQGESGSQPITCHLETFLIADDIVKLTSHRQFKVSADECPE